MLRTAGSATVEQVRQCSTVARLRSRRLFPAALSGEPGIEIILKANQGEAERDRLEVFAIRSRSGPNRVSKIRRTAGMNELPPVRNTLSISSTRTLSVVEQIVDGFFDPLDVVPDPPLEIRARNFLFNMMSPSLSTKSALLRR